MQLQELERPERQLEKRVKKERQKKKGKTSEGGEKEGEKWAMREKTQFFFLVFLQFCFSAAATRTTRKREAC